VPGRRDWVVQPDLGDEGANGALTERTGHRDAVMAVEHVARAAALVKLDRLHPAARHDLGGYSLKPRPHAIGGRPETAVKTLRGLHCADNLVDQSAQP
jgi:hypothetical protein